MGGDYYDILSLPDDLVALAIADISGKGVPAAILMSNLQAAFRTVTKTSSHPLDVCTALNQHLYEVTGDSKFATFFYAEWHPRLRKLCYLNAGHDPPILLGAQGIQRSTKGGLPLGMFPQIDYEMGEHVLEPGDLLVLYSDGITEHESKHLGEFGDKRLEAVLEANQTRPLKEIQQLVLSAVGEWSDREREDDMTLVLARATVNDWELA